MSPPPQFPVSALTIAAAAVFVLIPRSSIAGSTAEIDRDVDTALASLYGQMSEAMNFSETSKGILAFPKIVKGGLVIVGAQSGEGALRVNGKTVGYYSIIALSYGLQLGVQWFGHGHVLQDGRSPRESQARLGAGPIACLVATRDGKGSVMRLAGHSCGGPVFETDN